MTEFQIIATIGPASRNLTVIEKLIQSGMTMARLSMAHDTYSAHTQTISLVRKACSLRSPTPSDYGNQPGVSVPILQDLQGPKLRIGKINVKLARGQLVTLAPAEHLANNRETQISKAKGNGVHIPLIGDIHQHVKVGDVVLINNGVVQLEVKEAHGISTVCEVKYGGGVRTEKGVNLPMTDLPTKAITPKDKEDLLFGLRHQVEWVALSFVKSENDITELKEWLERQNPQRTPLVMSKIETREAIENLSQIIEASDAVMVARGDLALEVSFAKLPFLQKRIILECRSFGKPVVVATGFMDSMCHKRVPSRAEVMDVANASLDGATGILLSQETAVGRYPVETVEMVASILSEIEKP
ncbi:MAG: pyruvate kinase [Candidatus Poribacteria bacterium]